MGTTHHACVLSNTIAETGPNAKENTNPNVASYDVHGKLGPSAKPAVPRASGGRPSTADPSRGLSATVGATPASCSSQMMAPKKTVQQKSRLFSRASLRPSKPVPDTQVAKLASANASVSRVSSYRPMALARTSSVRPTTTRPPVGGSNLSSVDIRTQLKMMEASAQKLSMQVDLLSEQLYSRGTPPRGAPKVKSGTKGEGNPYEKQLCNTKSFLDKLEQALWAANCRHSATVDGIKSMLECSESQLKVAEQSLKEKVAEIDRKNVRIKELEVDLSGSEKKNNELRGFIAKLELESREAAKVIKAKEDQIETQMQKIATQEEQIESLELQALGDEQIRRQLHNSLQELKGNIRVFCRMRAWLPEEAPTSKDSAVHYVFNKFDPTSVEIVQRQFKDATGCKQVPDKKHFFKFDYVFQSNSTQQSVFSEISQLVQSALDGYHACIFAYGQTGSGKTYTMEGPGSASLTAETEGMISRAVKQIFMSSDKLKSRGWRFEMHASFLEIYNELIRDLLDSQNSSTKKCDVHHDPATCQTTVSNQLVVPVDTPGKVHELLQIASRNRVVGATRLNLHSSRSHSVFQLRITGKNDITGTAINGLLNLIDLAGSERVTASGATGERFTETKHINKSLCCLKNVIAALANKDKHVPFRDSKLTYLLQNSLGGHSKTLMFVNVSPSPENFNETLNSLRFASQVNACEIGTARKTTRIDLSDLN